METTDYCGERTYSLGAVARLTGLSPHVLRAWERRYAAVHPLRSPGGTRRYREADVERLRLLRSVVQAGHSIGEVAAAPDEDLTRRLALRPELPAPALAPILAAIEELDSAELARLLGRQLSALGAREFVHRVASPLLCRLGMRWIDGGLCIASEHLASATLRSLLGAALQPRADSFHGAPLLFTTLPGDPHDLGALMAAVIAAEAGAHAIFVGANLPVAEIADAAVRIESAAVAIGASFDPGNASDALCALRDALPEAIQLWIGGDAAAGIATPPAVARIADLADLERKVTLLCERRP